MREILTVGELLSLLLATLLLSFLLTSAPNCGDVQNTEEVQEEITPECSDVICIPPASNQKGS